MIKLIQSIALTGIILLGPHLTSAQSEGKKYDNPEWKNVVLIDYKPGMYNDAREIINQYHAKASEMAGTPGPETVLELNTGEWDIMAIWGMDGGISDMDWDVHPDDIKWRKAMNELAGGEKEAQAIMKKYSSMINRSSNTIARVR